MIKNITCLAILVIVFITIYSPVFAQEEGNKDSDTLASFIEKVKSDVDLLKRLKISGYVQAQWQRAQQPGIESFAGGNFPTNVQNRFSVRRGRVKVAYEWDFSQFVLQIDVTERGVAIKDAYASLTDPWTKYFTVTGGIFNRPFGYEIAYSSSNRESPERSRFTQTLFPGEREVGAKLLIQAPKTSRFNFLSLEGGIFNGSGPVTSDFDSYKDFMGRLAITRNTTSEKIRYGLGVSYYRGGWRQGTASNYQMDEVTLESSQKLNVFHVDTSASVGDRLKREYVGADLQLAFDFPFGITQIRSEYVFGTQPGTSKSSISPITQPVGDPFYVTTAITDEEGNITGYSTVAGKQESLDAYLRKFNGFYLYFIQNIGQTKHQFVFKYDWYDPNKDVKGDDIASSAIELPKGYKATNAVDLTYNTIGVGWAYRWNAHVKLSAYYDFVRNETSSHLTNSNALKDFSKDVEDDVFTLRLQYKF